MLRCVVDPHDRIGNTNDDADAHHDPKVDQAREEDDAEVALGEFKTPGNAGPDIEWLTAGRDFGNTGECGLAVTGQAGGGLGHAQGAWRGSREGGIGAELRGAGHGRCGVRGRRHHFGNRGCGLPIGHALLPNKAGFGVESTTGDQVLKLADRHGTQLLALVDIIPFTHDGGRLPS